MGVDWHLVSQSLAQHKTAELWQVRPGTAFLEPFAPSPGPLCKARGPSYCDSMRAALPTTTGASPTPASLRADWQRLHVSALGTVAKPMKCFASLHTGHQHQPHTAPVKIEHCSRVHLPITRTVMSSPPLVHCISRSLSVVYQSCASSQASAPP